MVVLLIKDQNLGLIIVLILGLSTLNVTTGTVEFISSQPSGSQSAAGSGFQTQPPPLTSRQALARGSRD